MKGKEKKFFHRIQKDTEVSLTFQVQCLTTMVIPSWHHIPNNIIGIFFAMKKYTILVPWWQGSVYFINIYLILPLNVFRVRLRAPFTARTKFQLVFSIFKMKLVNWYSQTRFLMPYKSSSEFDWKISHNYSLRPPKNLF